MQFDESKVMREDGHKDVMFLCTTEAQAKALIAFGLTVGGRLTNTYWNDRPQAYAIKAGHRTDNVSYIRENPQLYTLLPFSDALVANPLKDMYS